MKKLFFYAMLILTVVLTGCGKSEEQKIHSMYLNNSTKVAEMETEQAQAMLENRNIDKQKMFKQIKSLIEENEKNIAKLSDEKYDEAKANESVRDFNKKMMESKDNGPSKKDGEKAIKRYQIANYAKSVKDYLQAYNVYLKRVCSNMEQYSGDNGPMEMEAFEKVEFQNAVLQHDLNWYGMANDGEFHKGAAYLDCSGASYRVQQIGDSKLGFAVLERRKIDDWVYSVTIAFTNMSKNETIDLDKLAVNLRIGNDLLTPKKFNVITFGDRNDLKGFKLNSKQVLTVECQYFLESKYKDFNLHWTQLELDNGKGKLLINTGAYKYNVQGILNMQQEENNGKATTYNNNNANISVNSSGPKYNLFQPQAFLNGDKYIPEVFQRQGAHRYVDCRSAKILSRNNGQTIVQYDMIVIGSTGKQSRQQCIVGLLTGKGYLVQYQADDGSWHPMDRTTASLAGYNAGLVLIDYLQL